MSWIPKANRKPGRGAERSGWRSAPPRRIGRHHDDRTKDHPRQSLIVGAGQAARQRQPSLQDDGVQPRQFYRFKELYDKGDHDRFGCSDYSMPISESPLPRARARRHNFSFPLRFLPVARPWLSCRASSRRQADPAAIAQAPHCQTAHERRQARLRYRPAQPPFSISRVKRL